jgi:hypothetical protein
LKNNHISRLALQSVGGKCSYADGARETLPIGSQNAQKWPNLPPSSVDLMLIINSISSPDLTRAPDMTNL